MKMSRRKLFGVSLGGAIAGPSVAREAVNAASARLNIPSSVPYYGEATKLANDPTHTYNTLAKLKRLATGDIRDEDRNHPSYGPPEPFRSLRSVSEDARVFMRDRRNDRQWRERTIKQALDALALYDKTGILREFF